MSARNEPESVQLSADTITFCCQATLDTFEIYIGSLRFDCPKLSVPNPHAMSYDKLANPRTINSVFARNEKSITFVIVAKSLLNLFPCLLVVDT